MSEIEELKIKHKVKELFSIDLDDAGTVLIKKPSRAVWGRFVDALSDDDASKSRAITELVDSCVVDPEQAEFKTIVDEYPAIVQTIANTIKEVAGLSTKKKAVKL
jgi:hypothetical protein